MHTIIKIAVVSVLALFAIVGVVSISEAEYTSVNSNGTHYFKKYRIDGKFALPLKSIISKKMALEEQNLTNGAPDLTHL